jgi:hypothetical protein
LERPTSRRRAKGRRCGPFECSYRSAATRFESPGSFGDLGERAGALVVQGAASAAQPVR